MVGDDHPKACTGRRLLHRGLAGPAGRAAVPSRPPVVLDPFADEPLSAADRSTAERGGLLAVDCSWNRLSERGRFFREGRGAAPFGRPRRLPLLVATNPQHFGRLAELNTAEALAAALYVLGRPAEASAVLVGFPGGEAFFEVNRDRLDRFARAATADDVRAAERSLFGP